MRFFFITCLFLCCSAFSLKSQNWSPVGGGMDFWIYKLYTDTVSNLLYASGGFHTAGGVSANGTAKWNGTAWSALTPGTNGRADAYCWYNGEFYIGGPFNADGILYLAKWNGTKWSALPVQPFPTKYGAIDDLLVYNKELYVCGKFDTIGGIAANNVAKWNGTNWVSVNFPLIEYSTHSMAVYKGDLYVGGNFDDSVFHSLAKYDGVNWTPLGNGVIGTFANVNKLIVYKNELYVGGPFSKYEYAGNPGNAIAKWDGNAWSDVGGGTSYTCTGCDQIFDMAIFNNNLYAVGVFSNMGGIRADKIAYWDGTKWCGLGNYFNAGISSISVYHNELYIACGKTINSDTVNCIAKWIGGTYVDTCGNTSGVNDPENNNLEFRVYPNPTNGKFTIRNDKPLNDGYELEIYNLLGETIYRSKINRLTGSTIDISNQPNGVYILQVNSKNATARQRIIIQK